MRQPDNTPRIPPAKARFPNWLVWLIPLFTIAGAAQVRQTDLGEMSLEQLMNLEVTTIGRKRQSVNHIPAAVYVITQEEIRRSGATTIPDLLRLVPGVEVAQIDNANWAISIRGFNYRSSNKLLVLVDGRTVYYPIYSSVFWDAQDTLLEDIERIEVIRGPGASLWGANAVNGVINIITKRARDTTGSLVSGGGGNKDRGFGAVRYGGTAGSHGYYRIFGKFSAEDNLVRWPGLGGWPRSLRGGFRSDWDLEGDNRLTVQGDLYHGTSPQAVYRSPFLREPITTDDHLTSDGGDLLLRWRHRLAGGSETAFQAYYDRSRHPDLLLTQFHEVVDFDFQHHVPWERHDVLWGAGFRNTHYDSHGTWELSLQPKHADLRLFSGFVQDEIKLVSNRLLLTAGVKWEHNGYSGLEVQPTLRLLWTPTHRQVAWASFSRAVRTPSAWEAAVNMNIPDRPLPDGTPIWGSVSPSTHLRSEELLAYETGYRVQPGKNLSFDVAAFFQRYNHLTSLFYEDPVFLANPIPHLEIPIRVTNQLRGNNYGAEVAGSYAPLNFWKITGSYSWLRQITQASQENIVAFPGEDGDNPRHQFQLHSFLNLPQHLEADAGLYYVGRLRAQGIDRNTRVDARLGWQPTPAWELSVGGQNLLRGPHYEFYPAGDYIVPGKVGRSIYGRLIWRF